MSINSTNDWEGLPFLQSLCIFGPLDQCRFGISLTTSGTGNLLVGGVEQNTIQGHLIYAGLEAGLNWAVQGSVIVNGSVNFTNQVLVVDSANPNVSHPP